MRRQQIYQIIRILRMIRFASLMNRLYATAVAVGGSVIPGGAVKPQYAFFINLIYGGLAILSFLSCLLCAPPPQYIACMQTISSHA